MADVIDFFEAKERWRLRRLRPRQRPVVTIYPKSDDDFLTQEQVEKMFKKITAQWTQGNNHGGDDDG